MGFLRLVLIIAPAMVAATARRQWRGPRLGGWTIGFELAVATVFFRVLPRQGGAAIAALTNFVAPAGCLSPMVQ